MSHFGIQFSALFRLQLSNIKTTAKENCYLNYNSVIKITR